MLCLAMTCNAMLQMATSNTIDMTHLSISLERVDSSSV